MGITPETIHPGVEKAQVVTRFCLFHALSDYPEEPNMSTNKAKLLYLRALCP